MANSNLPVVTVKQFCDIVKLQMVEGNKRPIFGLGKGGIGKTESIADLAKKELKVGYIDIRLLMYSEVDLKGIPYPDENHVATIWLQNDILPKVERDGKTGILVLDEITSVARSVRTAAYQLLNERRLGEYVLPDGWLVVCLGNGEEDGGDYQGMEGNFANRCSIFNVVPDLESWKRWAYESNINYLVIAFLSWRPSELHTYNPESETDLLFASPRSWKAVSDILNIHPFDKNDDITHLRIIANLGSVVGNTFISFCKFKSTAIEPQDIIDGRVTGYNGDSLEVLFMTIQGVIKLITDATKADTVNRGALTNRTVNYWINGIKWMLSLKALEHQVMALKDLVSSNITVAPRLLLNSEFKEKCPEFVEFTRNNSGIFGK